MSNIVLLLYIVYLFKTNGFYLRTETDDPMELKIPDQGNKTKKPPHVTRVRASRDPLIDPRDQYYNNPHHGYEPYWPKGVWFLNDGAGKGKGAFFTKVPLVCGEECEFIYLKLGTCCGHQSNEYDFGKCSGKVCTGEHPWNMTTQYRTFNTYCEFLNAQCSQPDKSRWVFLYMGRCIKDQDTYFVPIRNATDRVNRMEKYISDFGARYDIAMKITKPKRVMNFTTPRSG